MVAWGLGGPGRDPGDLRPSPHTVARGAATKIAPGPALVEGKGRGPRASIGRALPAVLGFPQASGLPHVARGGCSFRR